MSEIYQILQDFSEATFTKAYLADSLQFLNWLPSCLQWWRSSALGQLDRQRKLWLQLWADLERRVEQQRAQECLAKRWLEVDQMSKNGRSISREQWAFFAGSKCHWISAIRKMLWPLRVNYICSHDRSWLTISVLGLE